MRAAREQPRIVIAKALALACLLAAGIAIGAAINGEDEQAARATQVRLDTAAQTARERDAELQRTRQEMRDAVAARARARRALARLRRDRRSLRRDLLVARHLLRRERSRR